MKVAIIGGGPGGLYLAILLRRANPATQVTIYERNRIEDTFGFGVVLSDATEGILAEADDVTHAAMSAVMHRWGDIDVHYQRRSASPPAGTASRAFRGRCCSRS